MNAGFRTKLGGDFVFALGKKGPKAHFCVDKGRFWGIIEKPLMGWMDGMDGVDVHGREGVCVP
mgnify:CR=1 FL=1